MSRELSAALLFMLLFILCAKTDITQGSVDQTQPPVGHGPRYWHVLVPGKYTTTLAEFSLISIRK